MTAKKRPVGAGRLDEAVWARIEEASRAGTPPDAGAELLRGGPADALAEVGARLARSGEPDELLRLAESSDPAVLTVAVEGLGECPSPDAARRLAELAEAPELDKELRRSARRALHRLRSRGMAVPAAPVHHPAQPPVRPAAVRYQAVQGLLSAVDATGFQAVRVAVERPEPDLVLVFAIIDPNRGIVRCSATEASRRAARESYAAIRVDQPDEWVEAPGDYALYRIREAIAINQSSGTPLPSEYQLYAATLDRVAVAYDRPLIYQRLELVDLVAAIPTGDRLDALLEAFPISAWALGEGKLDELAAEAKAIKQSRIVISPAAQREREDQIRRRAWELALDEKAVAHLKRSLEETAFYFLARGHRDLAVTAAQAALALAPDSGINVRRHPLALALIDRGLGWEPSEVAPPDVDPTTGYRRMGGAVLLE